MEDNTPSLEGHGSGPEICLPAAAVSRGIGIGHAVFVTDGDRYDYRRDLGSSEVEAEIERFRDAVQHSCAELNELISNAKSSKGSASDILGVHLLILDGSSFVTNIENSIREQLITAEWAIRVVVEEFASRQRLAAEAHLRDKYLDVKDVAERIQRALGPQLHIENLEKGAILIVSELMPSQLIELAKTCPKAIITEHGGWTSHASILARELKIPIVTGVRDIKHSVSDGDQIIVDGFLDRIFVNPCRETIEKFTSAANNSPPPIDIVMNDNRPVSTLDGLEIIIRANAEVPNYYEIGANAGAAGIGLYRSEVLISQYHGFPTEAEQLQEYRKIANSTGKYGVRIRTFDTSIDQIEGSGGRERNPALGLRSIRLSLTDSTQYRTQIRAILQVSVGTNVDIILPMINGVSDISALKEMIREEKQKLGKQGTPFGDPRIGAMIEIPSAVMTADEIARHVDFICLGTNDLVQYLLAVDRDNETVADWYQTLHPAMIRAIRQVINAGNKAAIPVAICGEMAGSAFYIPMLIGLGARELSMNVNSIQQVRRLIKGMSVSDAEKLVSSLDVLETADEIEDALRAYYMESWAELFPPGLLSSKYPQ